MTKQLHLLLGHEHAPTGAAPVAGVHLTLKDKGATDPLPITSLVGTEYCTVRFTFPNGAGYFEVTSIPNGIEVRALREGYGEERYDGYHNASMVLIPRDSTMVQITMPDAGEL